MLIRDSQILRISGILCLMFQIVFAGVKNDSNYKENSNNIELLQVNDPELREKIGKAAKNPAFADQEFCFTDPSSLNAIKPDDIVIPLNANLSLEESRRFLKYFQDEYVSNSSILSSLISEDYSSIPFSKIETNYVSLVEHKFDDNYITVVIYERDSTTSNKIKAYFMAKKENIAMDPEWYYDFTIKDDFAFCYFCKSDFLKPRVCNIRLEAKTGGALNTIDVQLQIYFSTIESDEFTVFKANLEGGPKAHASNFDFAILCLYLLMYLINTQINCNYSYELNYPRPKAISAIAGNLINSCMVNIYCIGILLSICYLNAKGETQLILTLTFCFLIFCIIVIEYCTILPESIDAISDEAGQTFNDYVVFIHLGLFIIAISSVYIFLAQFMLYKVYMCPTTYFLLGNMYIIPIVLGAIGRITINDYFVNILTRGFFIGIFPFTKCGPYFWTDGFDLTWFCLFMLSQVVYATIVGLQQYKGSRFFLPSRCRRHTYLDYKINLKTNDLDESLYCDACLNSLYDVELEYQDLSKIPKYKIFDSHCYLKLPCEHIFHPNCLFRRLKQKNECPICKIELPPCGYDDLMT